MAAQSMSFPTVFCCFFFFFFSFVAANDVIVGGKSGEWKIPSSSKFYTQWARHARFLPGDFLVFQYEAGKDSVLQVTAAAYQSCNTSNPISNYTGGSDVKVKLDRPGPFYFISGAQDHCKKGQKLRLVVITPRHTVLLSPAPSPSSSPEKFDSTAVPPTSSAARSHGGFVVFGLVLGLWAWF